MLTATGATARADDEPPENPDLERARVALDDLKYTAALSALNKALKRGGNAPAALAEIHRLKGEVAAALGRDDEAVDSFEHLLAIVPDASLGAGVSPKIREPFAKAQASMAEQEPLELRCEIDRSPPSHVALVLETDPLNIVRGMAVILQGEGEQPPVEPGGEEPFRVQLPRNARAAAVTALDENGNQVRVVLADACEDVTPTKQIDKGDGRRDAKSHPFYARWVLWAGVALAGAGLGTYFGLETVSTVDDLQRINGDSGNHEFAEADELESRARRSALWSNLCFAAAGVSAVAATILFLRRNRAGEERSAVLTPTADSDSVGMVLVLPF